MLLDTQMGMSSKQAGQNSPEFRGKDRYEFGSKRHIDGTSNH